MYVAVSVVAIISRAVIIIFVGEDLVTSMIGSFE